MPPLEVFRPSLLSIAEREFLLAHLGEETAVAMHDLTPDEQKKGVNPRAVRKYLDRFQELDALERHRSVPWVGVGAIRDSIIRSLEWDRRTKEIHAAGGPRHPSMHSWSGEGDVFRGGIGSDSAEMVHTEILDDGSRRSFDVKLSATQDVAPSAAAKMPWLRIKRQGERADDSLIHDERKGTLTCSVCDHTQSYNIAKGRPALALARARMKKHMEQARTAIERHRLLLRREYRAVR